MADDEKIVEVEIDGIVHETTKAYLVRIGRKQEWLPKSLVELEPPGEILKMPEWLAMERGLI